MMIFLDLVAKILRTILSDWKKGVKIHFENRVAICLSCKSYDAVKNGTYERKLIFLRIGEQICTIQKYKCKKCGKSLLY